MAKQTFTTGQVLTAAQMSSLQQTAMVGGDASVKTISYVLVAADAGTTVAMNSTSATTITVNTGLFASGDTVTIINRNSGACTITAGTATVSSSGSATLVLFQNQGGILTFTSASAATYMPFDTGSLLQIRTITATSDTLVIADQDDKLLVYSTTGTITATIPPNSSVPFNTGSIVNIIKTGATGTLSITQGSGVTIASAGATSTNPVITGQYKAASLLKVASDTWYVVGGIA